MKLGYIRVSTVEQNEERQTRALLEHGVELENLYIDKQSGKNADRERLKALLAFCRKGDVVITESISRIARNTKDLLTIVEQLTNKGVDFVSLKECIDTSTPQGKFMLTVFGAMADKDLTPMLLKVGPLIDRWYFTDLPTPRAESASNLQQKWSALQMVAGATRSEVPVNLYQNPQEALRAAVEAADPADRIVVFGSFYTVGEVLKDGPPRLHAKHLGE